MSTVDRGREAATQMQTLAAFAGEGPWIADVRPSGQAWIDVPDEDGHAWGMHGFPAAARHVAAWHPGVAIVLGAFLDDLADMHDEGAIDLDLWPTLTAFLDTYLGDRADDEEAPA